MSTDASLLQCPRCGNAVSADACNGCGLPVRGGPYPGTLSVTTLGANFFQALDPLILEEIVPLLDEQPSPTCTERIIAEYAAEKSLHIGNPVWEGRADFARDRVRAGSTVLDVGCGFGTYAIAMARSADRVIALDRSEARVAITAARARAEGLTNVTAIHAEGVDLPVADESCDIVTVVGVLEWVGVGTVDPLAAQRSLLAEVARVLKPDGQLVLGIENRYGGHYFAGAREEHTGLRFISLLPRALSRAYSRLVRRAPFEQLTHSRRGLVSLLADVGLTARFAYPFPSYSEPQFTFDEEHVKSGGTFYIRHCFHHSSPRRRAAAHVASVLPTRLFAALAPTFWVRGSKSATALAPAASSVTGTATCDGSAKFVDWDARLFVTRPRLRWNDPSVQPLQDGWNARRWLTSPVRERGRRSREDQFFRLMRSELVGRARPAAAAEPLAFPSPDEAAAVLALQDGTVQWLASCLARRRLLRLETVDEHSDLRLTNVVVDASGSSLVVIDSPPGTRLREFGVDATSIALDVASAARGAKVYDLSSATAVLSHDDARRSAIGSFLASLLPPLAPDDAAAVVCAAVIGDSWARPAPVPGLRAFLEWCARGELVALLANDLAVERTC